MDKKGNNIETKHCPKCGRVLITKSIKIKPRYNTDGTVVFWVYKQGFFPRTDLEFEKRPRFILVCSNFWCRLKPALYYTDNLRYFVVETSLEQRDIYGY